VSCILFDRARSSTDPGWCTIGELAGDAAERFVDREFLRFPGASLGALARKVGYCPSSQPGKEFHLMQFHHRECRGAAVAVASVVAP
jgi:hypothetical protein